MAFASASQRLAAQRVSNARKRELTPSIYDESSYLPHHAKEEDDRAAAAAWEAEAAAMEEAQAAEAAQKERTEKGLMLANAAARATEAELLQPTCEEQFRSPSIYDDAEHAKWLAELFDDLCWERDKAVARADDAMEVADALQEQLELEEALRASMIDY